MRGVIKHGLTLFCILAPLAASAGDTLGKIRDSQTMTFAYRETAPFSFTNDSKQIVGYSIDVCLKIAEAVKRELKLPNLKIQYLPVDSTTRFSSIIDGKADMECGSTTNNAERRTRVGFTIPHFFSSVRMIVKSGGGIKNWSDLRGKTIVITKSTTTIDLVNDRSNVRSLNIKVLEAKDDAESFSFVEQGKADAYAMDDVLLYSLRSTAKNPAAYTILGDPLSIEPYSLMFRKDDPGFKKVVDREMVRLISEGEMQKIYSYWFTQPNGPKGSNMNMPMGYLLRDSLQYPSDKTAQ
ncbi:amino acid ABC transporter substrate-binding protein, PAAT family (TC 3.A.1.3.-) [Collimonas sp. OK242]|jgi:glutamate/aspartate transport system substrate-binding protein|uniref:amino acid ABC transporter substrate-binding protein n=1 Tax=Collimonas sp. OK242 TaxID=1798195 RepID=UPI00089BFC61|nr:amino acid ABC transporter substrate-binding protein [Collimonas sp. OK242]SDY50590.1 amino acid ABC transporter substrate-binding protein, PAAT family (TC 3.A.1.3.-) [Collimonas sp. OK242]